LIAEGKKLERLLSEHSGDILPEEIMMEIKKIGKLITSQMLSSLQLRFNYLIIE